VAAHVNASGLFDATGLAAGSYTVTYTTSQSGCSAADDAVVTVNALRLLQLMTILYVQEAVWLFQDHLPAARGVAVI
jgi:hypothetical protein